nr:immunoglobulin heavy chain junction region [Macaca mulatta]MOX60886.1 immunoglobulin heavy chain junction region [Macaca mulatta]MOX63393.1 immunoglobulin heavy chain junction region [Macaca mulatta]
CASLGLIEQEGVNSW